MNSAPPQMKAAPKTHLSLSSAPPRRCRASSSTMATSVRGRSASASPTPSVNSPPPLSSSHSDKVRRAPLPAPSTAKSPPISRHLPNSGAPPPNESGSCCSPHAARYPSVSRCQRRVRTPSGSSSQVPTPAVTTHSTRSSQTQTPGPQTTSTSSEACSIPTPQSQPPDFSVS